MGIRERRRLGVSLRQVVVDALDPRVRLGRRESRIAWSRRQEYYSLARRLNEGHAMFASGDVCSAVVLGESVLAAQVQLLGPDDHVTLLTREQIAAWVYGSGDVDRALVLSRSLLADRLRVLGPRDPATFDSRYLVARQTAEAGDLAEGLTLARALLADQQRRLNPNSPFDIFETLALREQMAQWMTELGDTRGALAVLQGLLEDCERVLGTEDGFTFGVRLEIAEVTRRSGDLDAALAQAESLLAEQIDALGAHDGGTFETRGRIASWTAEAGDVRGGLSLWESILADQQLLVSPEHVDQLEFLERIHLETTVLLATRPQIARWVHASGDLRRALALSEALLADQRGEDPFAEWTLETRQNIATWTAEAGSVEQARALYESLLADQERLLGAEHPTTIKTRENIAALPQQHNKTRSSE
jgi:hypothetical protein